MPKTLLMFHKELCSWIFYMVLPTAWHYPFVHLGGKKHNESSITVFILLNAIGFIRFLAIQVWCLFEGGVI